MPKKVISMLEFLRTGHIFGVTVGSSTTEVFTLFDKPDYIWQSDDPNLSEMSYGSLKIWFFNDSQIVQLVKFYFVESEPLKIHGAKLNPWIIRSGLKLEATKRFLKSAKIEFSQTKPSIFIDQVHLVSGVTLIFDDPKHIYSEGLGWLGIRLESSNA